MADERTFVEREGTPGWMIGVIIVLAAIALAGVGLGWKGTTSAQDTRQSLNNDLQSLKQGYDKEIQSVQERLAQAEKNNTELIDDFTVVTKKLRMTQGELIKARKEAAQAREDSANQLEAMNTEVKSELATKASTDDVKAVSTDVGNVRTDLDSTKSDLKMARSEMGTLIAKNHDEIEQLRQLGERDYIEFTVAQKNKPQTVGSVTVELRGTNVSKNQFSLVLTSDDKRTEKRNRTVNEPIFFYSQGGKQPMEIVVNSVAKNKIAGYLSVPKVIQKAATGGGN